MTDHIWIKIGGLRQGRMHAQALKFLDKLESPTETDLEQAFADLRTHGIAIAKDGKRIDPAEFQGGKDAEVLGVDEWPVDRSNKSPK
ncbi:hypothetical protein HT136_01235 [Novosphingobium profundi]|uniref:hypothetical protein n=1 Tax=Novosphingobium profundi TaxID=1774954 RepID=UPI001BD9F0FF|nr:hypothetical protein [Novosphingobium profundi]MBT0666989.1 hypothetical protein [Novosphingobium profundi]